ncbi:hypothetical protein BHM03_00035485, partial [Ensete ventricosum]
VAIATACLRGRYHQLKLFPEEDSGPQSIKKPVVAETYDEIVFSEPSEAFFARVQNHPAVIVPRLPSGLNLPAPGILTESFGLFFLVQVQAHIAKLRRQLSMIDGLPQQSKAASGQ